MPKKCGKQRKKMKPASMPNEAGFIGNRSKLHLPSKQASFFYPCGLTILVDHFKLYLYYELTQLLLVNQ